MSVEGIASEVMDKLKDLLLEKMSEMIPKLLNDIMLPSIFKEITPSVIDIAKDVVETYLRDNNIVQQRVEECSVSTEAEFQSFKNSFSTLMNEKLKKREEEYYKYARCENLLNIYGQCMQMEPLYIPRQFRSDKFHVMSKEELHIITKMDLKTFQSRCEILRIRREEFSSRAIAIDKEVEELIEQTNMSSAARKKCLERWQLLLQEDIDKVNKKWVKKIEGMSKAFERDREFLQKHQQTRIKETPTTKTCPSDQTKPRMIETVNGKLTMTVKSSMIDTTVDEEEERCENSSTIQEGATSELQGTSSDTHKSTVQAKNCQITMTVKCPTSDKTGTEEIEKDENSSTFQEVTTSDLQSTSSDTNKTAAQTVNCQQKNLLSQSSNHPPLNQEQTPNQNPVLQNHTIIRKLRSSTSLDKH